MNLAMPPNHNQRRAESAMVDKDTDTVGQGALIEFAAVAEWIEAATSRSAKIALLSQYFAQLQDDPLYYAVHYFAGQGFPQRERRLAPIGELTLVTALSVLSGIEPAKLNAHLKRLGDLAEVAALVLVRQSEPILTLEDVAIGLEQLAKTQGRRKLSWVIRLLEPATSLEAKYLTRLLLGDLQIGLEEAMIEAAVAQMTAQPLEQIRWVYTLLGDLGKTALLARHNQLTQARMQLFQPLKFMLASAVQDPAQVIQQLPQGFAVETKYDGIRAQAHIAPAGKPTNWHPETVFAGIRVALFSRTAADISLSFPDLIAPLASLAPYALVTGETAGLILDGEIVPCQNDQILPVAALQPRLDPESPSVDQIASVPVAFVVYDVLYKDGAVLLNHPYSERRRVLESLLLETPEVRLAAAQILFDLESLEQQFFQARAQGQEGLMVKALNSCYRPGRRSHEWLKIKRAIITLDVVVTAAEMTPETAPWFSNYAVAIRASDGDPTLLQIGKVAVGLSQPELETLSDWIQRYTIEEFAEGMVRLVEPQIVLEITVEQLQPSQRYKSGYDLHDARIVRIRRDKSVNDIDTLDSLLHLVEQTQNWWDSSEG